jgi:hypothetical protein
MYSVRDFFSALVRAPMITVPIALVLTIAFGVSDGTGDIIDTVLFGLLVGAFGLINAYVFTLLSSLPFVLYANVKMQRITRSVAVATGAVVGYAVGFGWDAILGGNRWSGDLADSFVIAVGLFSGAATGYFFEDLLP